MTPWHDINRLLQEVGSAPNRKAGLDIYAGANLLHLSNEEREQVHCAIADLLNELPGDNNG
jgi:hypothetical protein